MTIILYYIPASGPCRAVMMTAEHLGINLEKKYVNLFTGEQLKPEFLEINPQHCVPTIDDDGFLLWESRAIQTYLANKQTPDSLLYPKDPKERAVVDRMLYFDVGTLFKAQSEYLRPWLYEGKPRDSEKEEILKKALTLFDHFLSKTTYAAGNHVTVADYSILANLASLQIVAEYDLSSYPKVFAWMERMKEEAPNYKDINETPLKAFKEFLKSRKSVH